MQSKRLLMLLAIPGLLIAFIVGSLTAVANATAVPSTPPGSSSTTLNPIPTPLNSLIATTTPKAVASVGTPTRPPTHTPTNTFTWTPTPTGTRPTATPTVTNTPTVTPIPPCGLVWRFVDTPRDSAAQLSDVAAISPDDIWAVGSHIDVVYGTARTLIEHWNGSTWSEVPAPNP